MIIMILTRTPGPALLTIAAALPVHGLSFEGLSVLYWLLAFGPCRPAVAARAMTVGPGTVKVPRGLCRPTMILFSLL